MPNRAAHHRANEETRPKDSSGVTGCVAHRRRDDLEHRQDDDRGEEHVAVQNAFDLIVADAEHRGNEIAERTDTESARHGVEPRGTAR